MQRNPNTVAGYTNNLVQGVKRRMGWSEIETSDGIYDWTKIDQAITLAHQNGKQIGIAVVLPGDPPAWLTATRYTVGTASDSATIVKPWDVEPQILDFTKQFCQHVDGKIDYAAISLGKSEESYLTQDVTQIGETMATALPKWTNDFNAVVDQAMSNLSVTPFMFAMGGTPLGPGSSDGQTAAVNALVAKYRGRFGVMPANLNANESPTYPPAAAVKANAGTNPCGFQFLCSVPGFSGRTLGCPTGTVGAACLQYVIDVGVNLLAGIGFEEIYSVDADDPANANVLKSEATKFSAGPAGTGMKSTSKTSSLKPKKKLHKKRKHE